MDTETDPGEAGAVQQVLTSRQLNCRVTVADYERWQRQAEREGLSLTKWVTKTLNGDLSMLTSELEELSPSPWPPCPRQEKHRPGETCMVCGR